MERLRVNEAVPILDIMHSWKSLNLSWQRTTWLLHKGRDNTNLELKEDPLDTTGNGKYDWIKRINRRDWVNQTTEHEPSDKMFKLHAEADTRDAPLNTEKRAPT